MLLFILTSCGVGNDIPTTITLVKAKLGEYRSLMEDIQQLSLIPSAQPELQDKAIKASSLLNECQLMLEQIDTPNIELEEGLNLYLDVLELKGDYGKSAECLEGYLRRNPEAGDYWVRLGRANLKKGKNYLEEAVFCLRKARKLQLSNESQALLWKLMGDIHWELREFDQAEQAYHKSLNFGDDVWPKVGLAGLDVARGDMKSAEDSLSSIGRALQKYDVPVRVRLREALLVFEQLTKEIPDSPEQYFAYSHILYRAGRIEDAIAVANYALFLEANNWKEWNFLGSVYLQYGYTDNAKSAFNKSLALESNQPEIKKLIEDIAKIEKAGKEGIGQKSTEPLILKKE